MDGSRSPIRLCATDRYTTEDSPRDAYKVKSGTVIVYIAPYRDGNPGRLLELCKVKEGRLIPSFNYTDEEKTRWHFILKAESEAELLPVPGIVTSVLQDRFAAEAELEGSGEDFAQRLLDRYRREDLKDWTRIVVDVKNNQDLQEATARVIIRQFDEKAEPLGDSAMYRAIAFACRYSAIPLPGPDKLSGLCGGELTVPAAAKAARFACREVTLEKDWHRRDCGAVVGSIGDRPVACVPGGRTGYTIFYGDEGRSEPLTAETAASLAPQAYVLYRTLPDKAVDTRELIAFGMKSVRRADLVRAALLGLAGTLIGLLLPFRNQRVFDEYIPLGDTGLLVQICALAAVFLAAGLLFDIVRRLSAYRIGSHVGYDLQNAVYCRIFSLPENFFRRFESADLAQRLACMGPVAGTFAASAAGAGLSALLSLLYLRQMFGFSAALSRAALLMLGVYGAAYFFLSRRTVSFDRKIEESRGETDARLFQFLSGIEKIRMAGAEERALYEYIVPFAERQSLEIGRNRLSAWSAALSGSVGAVFAMTFYFAAVRGGRNISPGGFMGFGAAFGAFSAAVIGLIDGLLSLVRIRPLYERIRPVLETVPEDDGKKRAPGRLTGAIRLQDVSFAYDKSGPNVIDGVDLSIEPGEYIGLVGASGCGKSTLLKLLLGFEEPDRGAVLHDGEDLRQLDKRELRKNLGVVMQNGKLIAGTIYENITFTAPDADMETVMRTVSEVGLLEDIEQMPMGLNTVVSDTAGTISGGQKQRILIARAIIGRPSVLIFDEATSALDNLAQAAVCENLDKMKATRIVAAHRLSTIKNCDRILVMQDGVISEEGSYEELMARDGLFRRLAERQLVESPPPEQMNREGQNMEGEQMRLTREFQGDRWMLKKGGGTFLTVRESAEGSCVTVAVSGKLTTESELYFKDELAALIAMGADVILDFRELEYISNACQMAMLAAQQQTETLEKGSLTLRNVPPKIYDKFKEINLHESLRIE